MAFNLVAQPDGISDRRRRVAGATPYGRIAAADVRTRAGSMGGSFRVTRRNGRLELDFGTAPRTEPSGDGSPSG